MRSASSRFSAPARHVVGFCSFARTIPAVRQRPATITPPWRGLWHVVLVFALAAAAMAALSPLSAQEVPPSSEVKATHGAWQLRCGRPPGAKQTKCALVQSVKAQDRQNVALTVIFLKSFDGKKQLLRIIAPLGVLLPTGLGLKIDGADLGHVPFLKCGMVGCIAEVIVKDDLIKKLKTGKNAIFIIFQTPEAGIGVPISLAGFAAGLKGLN